MTSEDLANHVEAAIRRCRGRVTGIGNEQYSEGEKQKFESMTPVELLEWALEEADDLIVYGVMTGIRINQILDQVKGAQINA